MAARGDMNLEVSVRRPPWGKGGGEEGGTGVVVTGCLGVAIS